MGEQLLSKERINSQETKNNANFKFSIFDLVSLIRSNSVKTSILQISIFKVSNLSKLRFSRFRSVRLQFLKTSTLKASTRDSQATLADWVKRTGLNAHGWTASTVLLLQICTTHFIETIQDYQSDGHRRLSDHQADYQTVSIRYHQTDTNHSKVLKLKLLFKIENIDLTSTSIKSINCQELRLVNNDSSSFGQIAQ